MNDLMALSVIVKGEVLSSNLAEFRESVKKFTAEINRDLCTDEQFGQAEIDVKSLKKLEEVHALAQERTLSQAEGINALLKELSESSEEVRKIRLDIESLIKREKERVKSRLIADALNKIECAGHLRLKTFASVVEGSIKGKRTLDSINKALSEVVETINEQLSASAAVIAEYEVQNEIVPDKETLVLGNAENVRLILAQRKQAREAGEEQKRLQKIADDERNERIKAQAEAKSAIEAQALHVETKPVIETELKLAPVVGHVAPVSNPAPEVEDEPEAQELARLISMIRDAFAPIKAARQSLKYPHNILLASEFAAAVLPAFQTLQKGGGA